MLGIVLAAGSGSRLGYLGGILPKTMVPVRGQPLLWHALRSLSALGVTEARVAMGPQVSLLESYVRKLNPRTVNLGIVTPHPLAHPTRTPVETLLSVLGKVPQRPFAVALGDDLTVASNLSGFLPRFCSTGALVGQAVVPEKDRGRLRRACEVRIEEGGRIVAIHEKPRSPRWPWRGCGLYLFDGNGFSRLVNGAERAGRVASMTDLVQAGVGEDRALAFPMKGKNINVNTVGDLLEAWQMIPRDLGEAL